MTENETLNKGIRERLKALMEKREISQAELCRRSGINKATLSNFLSGRYGLRQTSLYNISKCLDVPISWLLFGDEFDTQDLNNSELDLLKYYRNSNPKLQERILSTAKVLYEYSKNEDVLLGGGINENRKKE